MDKVHITLKNKVYRLAWNIICTILFRPSPRRAHNWRSFLLRLFGSKVGKNVHVYPYAKIWSPINLEIGDSSSIDDFVDCYNVEKIKIGKKVSISKYTFLCTASHDYHDPDRQLVASGISIGDKTWIASDVFIGPGVNIGNNTTILARVTLLKSVPSNMKAKHVENYALSLKQKSVND